MKRKIALKVLILALIGVMVFSVLALSACKKSESDVVRIEVVEKTLNQEFALDQQINYNLAKIKVHKKNGSSDIIALTPSMVTNFDSSMTVSDAVLTITYKGKSVDWLYSVSHDVPIESSFRIKGVRVSEEGKDSVVHVIAQGLEKGNTINAAKFEITGTQEISIDSNFTIQTPGFTMTKEVYDVRTIKVILFASDGKMSFKQNEIIIKLNVTTSGKEGTLYIQNITASDGEKDYYIPNSKEVFVGQTEAD